MAYEHKSGLSGAYDRSVAFPLWDSVLSREGKIGQAAEMFEAQQILQRKIRSIGNLVARDGDRVEGADIIIDAEAGTVTLTVGRLYINGRVLDAPAAVLAAVPMAGAVHIGVRLVETYVTELEEPALYGLMPGALSEGEAGAARIVQTLTWGFSGDAGAGDLYSVYLLKDGVAIDQTPPPNLTGINAQLAVYDFDANGNYIVTGCTVTALGKDGTDQVFSIAEGVANIKGQKRTRYAALRHRELETFDLFRIPTEVHTFGANPTIVTLNHGPIATIREVLVEKEVTETVVRGGTVNGSDALVNTGVTAILEVKLGGTTYASPADYVKAGDLVSWAPGGAEPAAGNGYTVKYRYLGIVSPTDITATSITVAGGVNGGQIQVDYDFKLPRVDILGMDSDGNSVYLKGVSSRTNALPPTVPADVLPLALIDNNWTGTPDVTDIGVRAYTMAKIDRMYNSLVDALDLIALERLQRDIDSREPISKNGVFVDPFTSDRYRDEGEPQTAAVFGGLLRLAIDPTFHAINLPGVTLLNWTEEVAVEQALATRCTKINPYQNFEPLPASMTINPPVDYWTETATEWASDSAAALSSPVVITTSRSTSGRTTTTTTTTQRETIQSSTREEALAYLRQISLQFTIKGFGAGENLTKLDFDGIDVNPGGLSADGTGQIVGNFTIPANVPAGSKGVVAEGQGGSKAAAIFVGQGTIDIETLRRVITTTVQSTSVTAPRETGGNSGPAHTGGMGLDPLAQTFTLPEGRHIAGVNLKVCLVGDPDNALLIEIVEVENGIPTVNVVAQAFYDMNDAVIGQWTEVRFPYPIWVPAGVEYAFVVKTNDANHSIMTAKLGDFDADLQQPVAAQPYSVGVMLSSSNAQTWTPHQDEDICFQLIAAKFAPTIKTVNVGTFAAANMSDLLIRAEVELPTAAAEMHFEVQLDDGSVTLLNPGQAWELQAFYTGNVQVRAVLTGSAKVSPVLFPVILAIEGELQTTGTYVTRAFTMGTGVDILSYLKTKIPTGATIAMHADAANDAWSAMAQVTQTPLQDAGWVERKYNVLNFNANPVGRIRITLTGTPAARPMAYDFRSISTP
ncbi:Phage related protein, virulence-associated [Mesorhizobium plurifarium]|uniref:Phage related protein, virulence-associated n=1 Tax=Mesorhizobium plurifarium TaxID=69974 RepID=A0A090GUB4_MESPL|nr:Phage related protein, virulence-associated [Mesorhizobium plurifarium]